MRQYKLENPDVIEQNRIKNRNWYRDKRESDPVWHMNKLEQHRQRYDRTKITPEGKAKLDGYLKDFRERQRKRMAEDPYYREEVLSKQREYLPPSASEAEAGA